VFFFSFFFGFFIYILEHLQQKKYEKVVTKGSNNLELEDDSY